MKPKGLTKLRVLYGESEVSNSFRTFDWLVNGKQARRDHLPPCSTDPPAEYETIKLDEIRCEEHLGGLIKSYERIAA